MAKLSKEAKEAFLEELNQLTRKHGIHIWGCGCCHSPLLERLSQDKTTPNHQYRISEIEEEDGPIEWADK
jgi:hypothetical protein